MILSHFNYRDKLEIEIEIRFKEMISLYSVSLKFIIIKKKLFQQSHLFVIWVYIYINQCNT